jgi:ATP-dependent HslUV protease ATP-binding subunit HslU
LLTQEEANKLIDLDQVIDLATRRVESAGVVFLDELDKVAGAKIEVGPDVSGQGVQRDLLPIVEGSTVMTRYGPVKTDHILWIAAGAFYSAKPGDLIPELQGRFPLRVELQNLSQTDFKAILTQPENALTRQYQALLRTEGVELVFTDDGLEEMAGMAAQMNQRQENIGARRLHTIIEKLLEELSFEAPDMRGQTITLDRAFVQARLDGLLKNEDLSKYIL